RDRLGGRIKAARVGDSAFDLGPAWFWDGQPRIAALIDRFGITRFEQFSQGDLVFENERGAVQRGRGHAPMQGSFRVDRGVTALTDALFGALPNGCVKMRQTVQSVALDGDVVTVRTNAGDVFTANQLVFALPPRVAGLIAFEPALPANVMQSMGNVPTWMAGQAKAVAVYDTPFWREEGLSGDAMSRFGPMVEIHDASPMDGATGALFGFIGVPVGARLDEAGLREQVLAQLGRLFGERGAQPKALFVKDWAFDAFTSTDADREPMYAHPHYGMPKALAGLWDGRIVFGGTEVASEFGGYLEGALEAAEVAFAQVNLR
ncbi:MAG: FAD-dependent oxidoreductase, partial [Amylibacter sp.]